MDTHSVAADPPLLQHLYFSAPAPHRRSTATALGGSLGLHVAVASALVWVSLMATRPVAPALEEEVTLIHYSPLPATETPPPPRLAAPPRPSAPTVLRRLPVLRGPAPPPRIVLKELPRGFQVLQAPRAIPTAIGPGGAATDAADYTGEGVEGGSGSGAAVVVPPGALVMVAPGGEDSTLMSGPTRTPFTVAPELKNREEVAAVLRRLYPRQERDAGIGGTSLVWLLIDEGGRVVRTRLKESSGHPALDRAALQVADRMKFSAGIYRDRRVKVWVAIPIIFELAP